MNEKSETKINSKKLNKIIKKFTRSFKKLYLGISRLSFCFRLSSIFCASKSTSVSIMSMNFVASLKSWLPKTVLISSISRMIIMHFCLASGSSVLNNAWFISCSKTLECFVWFIYKYIHS